MTALLAWLYCDLICHKSPDINLVRTAVTHPCDQIHPQVENNLHHLPARLSSEVFSHVGVVGGAACMSVLTQTLIAALFSSPRWQNVGTRCWKQGWSFKTDQSVIDPVWWDWFKFAVQFRNTHIGCVMFDIFIWLSNSNIKLETGAQGSILSAATLHFILGATTLDFEENLLDRHSTIGHLCIIWTIFMLLLKRFQWLSDLSLYFSVLPKVFVHLLAKQLMTKKEKCWFKKIYKVSWSMRACVLIGCVHSSACFVSGQLAF